jgi:hypothetical protein
MKILLQTTIRFVADGWHIGRFSALPKCLLALTTGGGSPLVSVSARDREARENPDPVLSSLHQSDFDQLWLFAVDTGSGLTPEDCEGMTPTRNRGGSVLATRDHEDLGSSLCLLGDAGAAQLCR